MSGIPAERQNLAERLADVLRRHERRGGCLHKLAKDCGGHERRDLLRWASGTTMPADVLLALIDELPRHLADDLIGATQYRLAVKDSNDDANALRAAAIASGFSADVANRWADGLFCHVDQVEAKEHAKRVAAELLAFAGA